VAVNRVVSRFIKKLSPGFGSRQMPGKILIIACLLLGTVGTLSALASTIDTVTVGLFSTSSLAEWQAKAFVGETSYRFVEDDGVAVLAAHSVGTASGLGRRIVVDLNKTPYLNWRWKVVQGIENLPERSKAGDDYAARVYVIKSGGAFIWRTKALNYVFSGSQPSGSTWSNAWKPKNSQMIAARGVNDSEGVWYEEKRNIREDFAAMFGVDIDRIDSVAIMTDSDNSGLEARARYGDIFFSSD